MEKVNQFTKQNILLINGRIRATLKQIEEELGLKITLGNVRFSEADYSVPLTIRIIDEGGEEKISLKDKEYAKLLGYPEVGTIKKINGIEYKVVGYNFRKQKMPIIIQNIANDKKMIAAPALFN